MIGQKKTHLKRPTHISPSKHLPTQHALQAAQLPIDRHRAVLKILPLRLGQSVGVLPQRLERGSLRAERLPAVRGHARLDGRRAHRGGGIAARLQGAVVEAGGGAGWGGGRPGLEEVRGGVDGVAGGTAERGEGVGVGWGGRGHGELLGRARRWFEGRGSRREEESWV